MRTIRLLFLVATIGFAASLHAEEHVHHPSHNMVLFGDGNAFYASHIVYKTPHNFQVILKLDLSKEIKTKIADEMLVNPTDRYLYLLDSMDIGKIESKPDITGKMFRVSADGSKQTIAEEVPLTSAQYSLIYFNELPLSLDVEADAKPVPPTPASSDWSVEFLDIPVFSEF